MRGDGTGKFGGYGKLTDFFACESEDEAQAIEENSDLPAEAFDRHVIYYVTHKKELILVYACPGCGGVKGAF